MMEVVTTSSLLLHEDDDCFSAHFWRTKQHMALLDGTKHDNSDWTPAQP